MKKAIKENNEIVETPRGEKTKSEPIEGFQIISLADFINNPAIPKEIMETAHQLYFDLIWVATSGSGTHFIDFVSYDYKKGSIFIIKEDQFHAWEINSTTEGFLLFFSDGFHQKMGHEIRNILLSEEGGSLTLPHINISDRENIDAIESVLKLINGEYNRKKAPNKVLTSLVRAFLTMLEVEYTNLYPSFSQPKIYSIFNKFQKLLDSNTLMSRNGVDYCNKLGVSYKELNEASKKISGFTLKSYIDQMIVTKAKRELVLKSRNISEIANALGFKETGNFSKFFKKQMGLTPKEFRDK